MHGTPPDYSGRRLVTPGVACVKRKRSEVKDAEEREVQMRLTLLFARLDPPLRPEHIPTNNLVTPIPASASESDTQSLTFQAPSLIQASGLSAVKEESGEHAAFFKSWPKLTGAIAQGFVTQSTLAVKDEPMGMEW